MATAQTFSTRKQKGQGSTAYKSLVGTNVDGSLLESQREQTVNAVDPYKLSTNAAINPKQDKQLDYRLERQKRAVFTGYREYQFCRSEKLAVIRQREEDQRKEDEEKKAAQN